MTCTRCGGLMRREETTAVLDQANAPGQAEYEVRLNDGQASQLTSIDTGQLAVRGELAW